MKENHEQGYINLKLMRDRDRTKLRVDKLAMVRPSVYIMRSPDSSHPAIDLIVDGVMLVLKYNSTEERDLDFQEIQE